MTPTATAVDLSVQLGPLTLTSPVVAASGTFGYGDEFADRLPLDQLGAVVTKTVTCRPRVGNAPHRTVETPSGMLNSIGLENVGLEAFRKKKLPRLATLPCPVVVSLGGEQPEELERLVEALEEEEVPRGYEINFSCPNVKAGGARFWANASRIENTVSRVRRLTRRSLWAKMSPNVTDPRVLARAAEAGGADALTVCNTFVGTSIDVQTRSFRLGLPAGGLSGPAIKPLALAQVHEVSGAVAVPLVASGGVMNARDVIEFVLAGASAVQVGTAHFIDPAAGVDIAGDLSEVCQSLGIPKLAGCVRAVRLASEVSHDG
jgi:dihydroorotate dehydrogenase (NAD+) catalytic subunit